MTVLKQLGQETQDAMATGASQGSVWKFSGGRVCFGMTAAGLMVGVAGAAVEVVVDAAEVVGALVSTGLALCWLLEQAPGVPRRRRRRSWRCGRCKGSGRCSRLLPGGGTEAPAAAIGIPCLSDTTATCPVALSGTGTIRTSWPCEAGWPLTFRNGGPGEQRGHSKVLRPSRSGLSPQLAATWPSEHAADRARPPRHSSQDCLRRHWQSVPIIGCCDRWDRGSGSWQGFLMRRGWL
jgi:hypothetical protein